MIIDTLENATRYSPLHKGIALAFERVRPPRVIGTERLVLDGEDVYVLFSWQQGKRKADAVLEAHKRYIDIHVCFQGTEEIGWRPLSRCLSPDTPYDEAKDFMTFSDAPEQWSLLTPRSFAIFFPEDAHAPMVSEGFVKKAVVKVAV